ncbi:MAG TPA: cobalamin-independent methionine synthase II family protein [bacterium]|nr:cobalamin-independent methionine synthase II family protein [bacterium]
MERKTIKRTYRNQELPLFPTAVVGSLPRPVWLLDLMERYSSAYVANRREQDLQTDWERKAQAQFHEKPIGREELNEGLDRAVEFAIGLQETAGIDIITDGELRRRSFTEVVCERVKGFEGNLIGGWCSAVTDKLERTGSIVADEARYLLEHTERPIKITLPSPYLMTQRHWSEGHSRKAYPTRREFLDALIPIFRAELDELMDMDIAIIQFDDPGMCLLVDEKFRANYKDPDEEIRMAVEGTNAVIEDYVGRERKYGTLLALHLCRAHRKRGIGGAGDYSSILDAIFSIQVDQYVMEFAVPEAGGFEVFDGCEFPENRSIGVGVVDVRSIEIDDPERIVRRVEQALKYFLPEQIFLNPDCGFAPGSTNPIQMDEAYRKLRALTEAARMLREKYGH